jgi:ABC-type amino acid transport substrate-binding protein
MLKKVNTPGRKCRSAFPFIIKLEVFLVSLLVLLTLPFTIYAQDLQEIKTAGVLRHLGIPYANFVTGSGDGLDIELMRGFAAYLGVKYQFVESNWKNIFGDLTGRHARKVGNGAEKLGLTEIKGDVVANGMTVLAWRKEVVDFSDPTFPSSVWLIARADSDLQPIKPSGSLEKDVAAVKESLNGHKVLALENTCLDPSLYRLSETKAVVQLVDNRLSLNEMAPAIVNNEADATILDVPDALIAMAKWYGQLKVIGPVSGSQVMGAAFRKDSPELLAAFNHYLMKIRSDGSYNKMVKKYYPTVFAYYAEFFSN